MKSVEPGLERSWFDHDGVDQDVVVAHRIRISRNLDGIPFLPLLKRDDLNVLKQAAREILTADPEPFVELDLPAMLPLERRLLVERNLVPLRAARDGVASVFLAKRENRVITVGDRDHFRCIVIDAGRNLLEAFRAVEDLENRISGIGEFAASLRLGYLGPNPNNLGTALRASVMLHLPGLLIENRLPTVLQGVLPEWADIRAFKEIDSGSLGMMYLISNRRTVGLSETDIVQKLEDLVLELVHYERNARERLIAFPGIKGTVQEALETLRTAESMDIEKMCTCVSWVRLGVSLGIIPELTLRNVTSLFFLGQNSHVIWSTTAVDIDDKDEAVHELRAKLVRRHLTV